MDKKIINSIVTNEIHQICKEYRDLNNFPKDYPRSDILWDKPDSLCKWTSHLMMFDLIKKEGMKIIDLGVGDSPVPHIISNQGFDVIGVDLYRVEHPYQSLVVMVLKDAIEFLKDYEENSIDVFLDGCAVTHFNADYDDQYRNKGWKSVCDAVYRTLKPGGYFISSSDIKLNEESTNGEFIIPEDVVKIAESSGLKLHSEFEYSRINSIVRNEGFPPGDLGVANFLFVKV